MLITLRTSRVKRLSGVYGLASDSTKQLDSVEGLQSPCSKVR